MNECEFVPSDDDVLFCQLHKEIAELRICVEKIRKELAAYRTAFNTVDDMTEYAPFNRDHFNKVAEVLTRQLVEIHGVNNE